MRIIFLLYLVAITIYNQSMETIINKITITENKQLYNIELQ